jgi:hypothetical protein
MGDPRYSKLSDGTLMIENTLDSDVGVYECMAKSPAGEVKSRAAKMHYQKTKGASYISALPQFLPSPPNAVSAGSGTERGDFQPLPQMNCDLLLPLGAVQGTLSKR